ncbi:MAG: TIGR01777 family oxidoreductase [Planctomycetota bacterium]
MKVLVTGASGFIGAPLCRRLEAEGAQVTRLVRGRPGADAVSWDPARGKIDADRLAGFDAVVHLAGEPVAQRWSEAAMERIRASRVEGTKLLAEALAASGAPPAVFVAASGIGIYGDTGEAWVDEDSPPGDDFLARVAVEWEGAAAPLAAAGARTVFLRTGMVLGRGGGALGKMLTPFRLGLGGRLGDGRQWVSWIGLDDLLGAYLAALRDDRYSGPINAVTPHPVTNRDLTRALGRALRRPAILPVPAFALRALFGPMADGILLAGQRVRPTRLEALRFPFAQPTIHRALTEILAT